MAREGHCLEWISPDDDINLGPDPFRSVPASPANRLGTRWRFLGKPAVRRLIGGLTVFAAVAVGSRVGQQHSLPTTPAKPPAWLENRPMTAPLSPFMAAECTKGRCHAHPASATDLRRMWGGLRSWYLLRGIRVVDGRGDLRATQVMVLDGQGDNLTVEAVRVPSAPHRWDAESVDPTADTPTSRWLLLTNGGIWLIESHSTPGECDTDVAEYGVLYTRALVRVRASQVGL